MARVVVHGSFEWDEEKEKSNKQTHQLDFTEASQAFLDPDRIIAADDMHSKEEERLFCIGKVGSQIATVRFTYREKQIRIIGAGYWRKGKKFYEEKNKKK